MRRINVVDWTPITKTYERIRERWRPISRFRRVLPALLPTLQKRASAAFVRLASILRRRHYVEAPTPTWNSHDLKSWRQPFQATWDGQKFYEIRKDDRWPRFEVGDKLRLHECDVEAGETVVTGRRIEAIITHISRCGQWELPEHLCVMSLGYIECFDIRKFNHGFFFRNRPVSDKHRVRFSA
jgi:hypothetical protein